LIATMFGWRRSRIQGAEAGGEAHESKGNREERKIKNGWFGPKAGVVGCCKEWEARRARYIRDTRASCEQVFSGRASRHRYPPKSNPCGGADQPTAGREGGKRPNFAELAVQQSAGGRKRAEALGREHRTLRFR
jgi:hypothetical protein